jgi:hypothetical protein
MLPKEIFRNLFTQCNTSAGVVIFLELYSLEGALAW